MVFLVILMYVVIYFVFELISENDFLKLNVSMYIYFIINGVLLFFVYFLLFLFEKIFGFMLNVMFVELLNINNDLLRRMFEIVLGIF